MSAPARARIEAMTRFLDDGMAVPGTRIRFGWDAILGLIPGIGDLITLVLALYLVGEAYRQGAPSSVLARMLANVGADTALGSIPVAGDLLDVAFKANRRNARILLSWLDAPAPTRRRSRIQVALLVGALALLLLGVLAGIVALWKWAIP